MLYRTLLVLAALVMSMPACDAQEPPEVPREQLLKDQTYAIETVKALANAIAPDETWAEKLFPESGCFTADGIVKGYKTSFNLDLRTETVGHDIDDMRAFEIARVWLAERSYEFIRDTQHSNGTREIRAVKEDETDGIGISIKGHQGIVAVKGTTKCRP